MSERLEDVVESFSDHEAIMEIVNLSDRILAEQFVSQKRNKVDRLGIIAGAGTLPGKVIAACREIGREYLYLRACRPSDNR